MGALIICRAKADEVWMTGATFPPPPQDGLGGRLLRVPAHVRFNDACFLIADRSHHAPGAMATQHCPA